jgi:hypothetical protein
MIQRIHLTYFFNLALSLFQWVDVNSWCLRSWMKLLLLTLLSYVTSLKMHGLCWLITYLSMRHVWYIIKCSSSYCWKCLRQKTRTCTSQCWYVRTHFLQYYLFMKKLRKPKNMAWYLRRTIYWTYWIYGLRLWMFISIRTLIFHSYQVNWSALIHGRK